MPCGSEAKRREGLGEPRYDGQSEAALRAANPVKVNLFLGVDGYFLRDE